MKSLSTSALLEPCRAEVLVAAESGAEGHDAGEARGHGVTVDVARHQTVRQQARDGLVEVACGQRQVTLLRHRGLRDAGEARGAQCGGRGVERLAAFVLYGECVARREYGQRGVVTLDQDVVL